jgi:hypothetical protein
MPQLIGVKSLSQTCLDFVVNNMDLLCEEPTSDFANSNQSINSPFDQLRKLTTINDLSKSILKLSYFVTANKLLEEIIIALRNRGGLKQFLGLLAVPHLETLNLRYLGISLDDLSIELDNSMQRCVVRNFTFTLPFKSKHNTFLFQNLKHLVFHPIFFSDEFFTSFIPKLSKLQVLDISYSEADDSSLEVIGTCCTHLR